MLVNRFSTSCADGHSLCLVYWRYAFSLPCVLQEVVNRFENQNSTYQHLMELKEANEKQVIRLKEEKARLQKDFEEMKYSGEAKLSR